MPLPQLTADFSHRWSTAFVSSWSEPQYHEKVGLGDNLEKHYKRNKHMGLADIKKNGFSSPLKFTAHTHT